MFGLFKTKEQREATRFDRSVAGEAIRIYNKQTFGPGGSLSRINREGQREAAENLQARLLEIIIAPIPLKKLREEIAGMTMIHAELTILRREPELKRWWPSQYVSWELHNHIRACAPHLDDALPQEVLGYDQDLYDWVCNRSAYVKYYLDGIATLRFEFNDATVGADPARDWLVPFWKSSAIAAEDKFRKKIGLPSLFDGHDLIGALKHQSFFFGVVGGEPDPLRYWEEGFGPHEALC